MPTAIANRQMNSRNSPAHRHQIASRGSNNRITLLCDILDYLMRDMKACDSSSTLNVRQQMTRAPRRGRRKTNLEYLHWENETHEGKQLVVKNDLLFADIISIVSAERRNRTEQKHFACLLLQNAFASALARRKINFELFFSFSLLNSWNAFRDSWHRSLCNANATVDIPGTEPPGQAFFMNEIEKKQRRQHLMWKNILIKRQRFGDFFPFTLSNLKASFSFINNFVGDG